MKHDMKLKIVLLNETREWRDDIAEKAGNIFAAYLLDTSRVTNCAELTPSYDLTFLYSSATNEIDDDLHSSLMQGSADGEQSKYVHCRVIDGLPDTHVYVADGLPWVAGSAPYDDESSYEEVFEACREYFCSNVKIDVPSDYSELQQVDPRQMTFLFEEMAQKQSIRPRM